MTELFIFLIQGVEPRWKGLSTSIPVFMVSNSSYRYRAHICDIMRRFAMGRNVM